MLQINNILCPTDFSACAQSALPIACCLARDYGAKLILLHVRSTPVIVVGEFGEVPPEPCEPDATLTERMRLCLPSNYKGAVECYILDGNSADEILKAAQERHCNLIVLGTHGRSGLRRLLIGSVAEAVLRQASCPVLTVKPGSTTPAAASSSDDAAAKESNLDPNDMVTVCSVANPAEAEVIRNALQSERIPIFVEGLQQAALVGTLGIPIKIQVRVGDFNRASKFIQAHEAQRR